MFDEFESEVEEVTVRPEFIPKDFTGYTIMIRFRSKEDLHDFATLIDQPRLKAITKSCIKKIDFPEVYDEEMSLENLMG